MSMARLRRRSSTEHLRTIASALAIAACLTGPAARAKRSDRSQQVVVHAVTSVMNQDKGLLTLTGKVNIDQGTMHVDGDHAVGYFDQNNQVQRTVVTGAPAHFQQQLDDGSMVHGSATTIDYKVAENTLILTGNAIVIHEGQGRFHGATLAYNTDSGQISGEGGPGGQVQIILQPKKPPSTSTPPVPSKPAAVPSMAPAGPASASTAGTH